jgi:hypothetical protein
MFSITRFGFRLTPRDSGIQLGGLTLWTRDSGGKLVLASYHPLRSLTWWWSVRLARNEITFTDRHYIALCRMSITGNEYAPKPSPWVKLIQRSQKSRRRAHWVTRVRLPRGYSLVVSQQDYHRQR